MRSLPSIWGSHDTASKTMARRSACWLRFPKKPISCGRERPCSRHGSLWTVRTSPKRRGGSRRRCDVLLLAAITTASSRPRRSMASRSSVRRCRGWICGPRRESAWSDSTGPPGCRDAAVLDRGHGVVRDGDAGRVRRLRVVGVHDRRRDARRRPRHRARALRVAAIVARRRWAASRTSSGVTISGGTKRSVLRPAALMKMPWSRPCGTKLAAA